MPERIIENPVINSPYVEPIRHFRFDEDGITNETVEERRASEYFMPIPAPKKKGKQLAFDTHWTEERIQPNHFTNQVRARVALWMQGGYVGVTRTTRRLLDYWNRGDRERRLFFCQREAVETAVYLTEVASKYGDAWILNELRKANDDANPLLNRIGLKMATGTGKTVVMAMLIAWQALNKLAAPQDARFTDAFLIVTPGITIRDRLRVLLPSDPNNYYRYLDLLPPDLLQELHRAKFVITNFHAFKQREHTPAGRLTKRLLSKGQAESAFTETPDQMVRRVCKDLGNKRNILVINDEAHHCYRRKPDGETVKRKVRVSGPFTVESLSPHRVLSPDQEQPEGERAAQDAQADFAPMINDNLRKAGIQNVHKAQRLKFDRLDSWAGAWIQAEGEFTDDDGLTRRVGVSIGPEYGTVGSEQIKEAAKEALRGKGFDLLVVCGLAFDAYAGETAKEFQPEPAKEGGGFAIAEEKRQLGKLPVLLVRINPDLTMGDELLKKTGAGNLFMAFGEPDAEVRHLDDGHLVVEVRGVDVYNPNTGELQSASADEIACWFIDASYNEESFFVRHAYFCGGDHPYDRLKRALRAEIDEAAWASLYSTISRPFPRPETGKIAIKVINHYGDEVMKVYEV